MKTCSLFYLQVNYDVMNEWITLGRLINRSKGTVVRSLFKINQWRGRVKTSENFETTEKQQRSICTLPYVIVEGTNSRGKHRKIPPFQLICIKAKRPLSLVYKIWIKYHTPSLPNYSTPFAIRQGRISKILGNIFGIKWENEAKLGRHKYVLLRNFWQLVSDFVFMEGRLRIPNQLWFFLKLK